MAQINVEQGQGQGQEQEQEQNDELNFNGNTLSFFIENGAKIYHCKALMTYMNWSCKNELPFNLDVEDYFKHAVASLLTAKKSTKLGYCDMLHVDFLMDGVAMLQEKNKNNLPFVGLENDLLKVIYNNVPIIEKYI